MLGRRPLAVVVALVVGLTLLSGCQPGKVGARCRTADFGDDGGHWVLQCRKGRWVRMITKQHAAAFILSAQQSSGLAAAGNPTGGTSSGVTPSGGVPAGSPAPIDATLPSGDDYPAAWRDAPISSVFDSWGYPNRQCTSFVAWRLSTRNGARLAITAGDAGTWDEALAPYYRVDAVPAVGAVAHWNPNESSGGLTAGPVGHVGWVQAVHPDGSVTVEQYNPGSDGRYVQYRTRAGRYIHVRDL